MMITVAAVWYAHRPFELKQANWEDVMAEADSGGYKIITTEKLRDCYQTAPSSLLLVGTRQEWEYRSGHIKGALKFPMEPTWWARRQKADELEAFFWAKTSSVTSCFTEKARHESAVTRRPGWP